MPARQLRNAGLVVAVAAGVTAVLNASPQQPGRDTASSRSAIGTGVISGTVVVDEPNGPPLRRVVLTLAPAGAAGGFQRMVTTDNAGRFAFTQLPAGNYSPIRATRNGFIPASYGQKRVGGIGTPIALAEGQRLTIELKMLRGAVATGTILDTAGKPMPQVNVQLSPVRTVDGVRTAAPGLFATNRATTDDRGVYRVFDLPPGDYVIAASPQTLSGGDIRPITEAEIRWAQQQMPRPGAPPPATQPAPRPAQAVSYAPIFYPGTTDGAHAATVTLRAGEERSGLDFAVQLVPTARIEGTVIDPEGRPAENVQLNLVAKDDASMGIVGSMLLVESMFGRRATTTKGSFSFAGVRPGSYTIAARGAPQLAGGSQGSALGPDRRPVLPMTLWASADISIDGNDLSGVVLKLQPGMTLSGRIVFDGTTLKPPPDLSRVSVRLSAAPTAGGVIVSVGVPNAQVKPDGTFTFEGVTPGRYLLSASSPAATPIPGTMWALRSALAGGVDAAEKALEIRPDQNITDAIVTFTDRMAEVSGTLLDATGKPTSAFSIILFSTDRQMWQQRSRRSRPPVPVGTDGKFRITNLLPGEYYLAALTDFEPNDYFNAGFLEAVAAAGAIKISIAEGEKRVQDLKVAGG